MYRILLIFLTFITLSSPVMGATVEGDSDKNGALDVSKGGTNAKTAAAARTNLGLGTAATKGVTGDGNNSATASGVPINGCVQWSNGNLISTGSACSGGGHTIFNNTSTAMPQRAGMLLGDGLNVADKNGRTVINNDMVVPGVHGSRYTVNSYTDTTVGAGKIRDYNVTFAGGQLSPPVASYTTTIRVYIPSGYTTGSNQKWVLLLHGGGLDHTQFIYSTSAYVTHAENNNVVLVAPNGYVAGANPVNLAWLSAPNPKRTNSMLEDAYCFAYQQLGLKDYRPSLYGMSMGGWRSLYEYTHNPDTYSSFGASAAPVDYVQWAIDGRVGLQSILGAYGSATGNNRKLWEDVSINYHLQAANSKGKKLWIAYGTLDTVVDYTHHYTPLVNLLPPNSLYANHLVVGGAHEDFGAVYTSELFKLWTDQAVHNSSTPVVLNGDGKALVGDGVISTSAGKLHIKSKDFIAGTYTTLIDQYGGPANINQRRVNGTPDSPAQVTTGQLVAGFIASPWLNGSFPTKGLGGINIYAAENLDTAHKGTMMGFNVNPTGSGDWIEAARFAPTGNLLVGTQTDNGVSKLQVNGSIKSLSGGFIFPDGTSQTTAAPAPGEASFADVFSIGTETVNPLAGRLYVQQSGTSNPPVLMDVFGAAPHIMARRAGGVSGAPTQVLSGQSLLSIITRPWFSDVGAYAAANIGGLTVFSDEDIDSMHKGSRIEFYTTNRGNNSAATHMVIASTGNVLVGTTTDNTTDKLQVNGSVSATSYSGNGANLTSVPAASIGPYGMGVIPSGQDGYFRSNSATGQVNLDTSITAGTYTPVGYADLNCTIGTVSVAKYSRIGNVVTVSGYVQITPSAAGVVQTRLSLPVASNLTTAADASGTSANSASIAAGIINADTTNHMPRITFTATDTTLRAYQYIYQYIVQ